MKILHFVGGGIDNGAGRGAYWLHQAQREIGIDSMVLTNGRETNGDASVVTLAGSSAMGVRYALSSRLSRIPLRFYPRRKPWIFNTGFTGVNFMNLPQYQEADLIHLHWINGLVGMRTLGKVQKPVVWTMRDMWPLSGGCHVGAAFGCDRYKVGCGQCPQLESKHSWDLSRVVVWNKRASLPKQLRVVGISQWLSDCASSSRAFGDVPVQTISNNIDTQTFFPVASGVARQALGLPADKRIILVGAARVTSFYKGFDLFLKAMKEVTRDDVHVVSFGRDARQGLASLDVGYTDLGFLSNSRVMRLAYSVADVFVAPSLMEAFGKTLAEAQSCGTPVVCFDATGPRDIVEHQVTGYKAQPFEASDLAKGIHWVLDQPEEGYELMRARSRERAVVHFDSRVVARQYRELYEEMLGRPLQL